MGIKAYLAPMCGVTDIAYRKVCRAHAKVITTTEMVSARALEQNVPRPLMIKGEGVQLVGNDPRVLAEAAKMFPEAGFIELNAGCPVHKVVKKGHGSRMLQKPELMRECVDAMIAATDAPVTVKTRLGWMKNTVAETAKALRGSGIERVVMHARTAQQSYGDAPDIAALREAVQLFDCPVTANGGIGSYESAAKVLESTGCEGVMVGRAAITNPFVFEAIEHKKDFEPTREQCADFFDEYASLATSIPFVEVRMHAAWLCHGFRYASKTRDAIVHAEDLDSVRSLLRE